MEKSVHITSRIIEKCLEGDIKSQYRLYKQFSKAMYNVAIRILNSKMDAEDVLQESFVKAFRELDSLKNREMFAPWLKRIVVNHCISFLRKKKIRFEDIESTGTMEYLEPPVVDDPAGFESDGLEPGRIEPGRIEPEIIHRAIKNLPDRGRTVLVLHALEGYKHREISGMLGISESTSKTQYSRALSILYKELKEVRYAE